MPFDVCPGAQHMRARPPSQRIREHHFAPHSPTFLALVFGVNDARHPHTRMRAMSLLGCVLGLMSEVEAERELAALDAAANDCHAPIFDLDADDATLAAQHPHRSSMPGLTDAQVAERMRAELSGALDVVAESILEDTSESIRDELAAALSARAEADDENETRSADCLERDEPVDP